jgi:hypothetical protein
MEITSKDRIFMIDNIFKISGLICAAICQDSIARFKTYILFAISFRLVWLINFCLQTLRNYMLMTIVTFLSGAITRWKVSSKFFYFFKY